MPITHPFDGTPEDGVACGWHSGRRLSFGHQNLLKSRPQKPDTVDLGVI